MKISSRKVLEVLPRLHEKVKEEAERRHLRISLLSTVLIAYGIEHIEKAIAEADHLINNYED